MLLVKYIARLPRTDSLINKSATGPHYQFASPGNLNRETIVQNQLTHESERKTT